MPHLAGAEPELLKVPARAKRTVAADNVAMGPFVLLFRVSGESRTVSSILTPARAFLRSPQGERRTSALRAGFCFMGAARGVGAIASATRPGPIDPTPALHRRALAHFPDPVSQVGMSLYLQKFAGFAEPSIDQRSLPGPSGDVGNAVPVTGKVMRLRKRAIQYIELAFDRHGEPVDRVLDPGRRAGEEAPETAADTRRAAPFPEQRADRLDPFR